MRCVYVVEKTGECVVLSGKEAEGNHLVFVDRVAFPLELEAQVRNFARALSESQTLPRMMIELAEEYFSSAVFE